jgi:hypothetical protein
MLMAFFSSIRLLRSVINIKKENPSIIAAVFPNFLFLVADILKSFWNLVRAHPVNA